MSLPRQVALRTAGPLALQYTDDALAQLKTLEPGLSDRLDRHMQMVAAVNAYAHGKPVAAMQDRLETSFETLNVIFWVSVEVQRLTVVDVSTNRSEVQRPYSPFQGFEDDDDS